MAKTVFKLRIDGFRAQLELEHGVKVIFTGEKFKEVYPKLDPDKTQYVVLKMNQKEFREFIKKFDS